MVWERDYLQVAIDFPKHHLLFLPGNANSCPLEEVQTALHPHTHISSEKTSIGQGDTEPNISVWNNETIMITVSFVLHGTLASVSSELKYS